MIASGRLAGLAHDAGLLNPAMYLLRLDRSAKPAMLDAGPPLYPASMIKTPIAVATAQAVATGRLDWDDRLAVDVGNMTANDAPSPLQPGYHASVAELVELMLRFSDNVATNMLIDALDRQRASRDLGAIGFPQTAIHRKLSGALPLLVDPEASGRNTHPPRDAAELFVRIARDEVPGAERIRSALALQHWNGKLSTGLLAGDRFAHKTGDTDDVSHDGGILDLPTGERYVLVVYTALPSNDTSDRRFGTFMRALRPFLGRVETSSATGA